MLSKKRDYIFQQSNMIISLQVFIKRKTKKMVFSEWKKNSRSSKNLLRRSSLFWLEKLMGKKKKIFDKKSDFVEISKYKCKFR